VQLPASWAPMSWGQHMEDGDYFELLDASLEEDAHPNARSAALFASVIRAQTESVEKLLLGGASVNCADKIGRTPLHHACK